MNDLELRIIATVILILAVILALLPDRRIGYKGDMKE